MRALTAPSLAMSELDDDDGGEELDATEDGAGCEAVAATRALEVTLGLPTQRVRQTSFVCPTFRHHSQIPRR